MKYIWEKNYQFYTKWETFKKNYWRYIYKLEFTPFFCLYNEYLQFQDQALKHGNYILNFIILNYYYIIL